MNNVPTIKPEWLAGITMTQVQKDQWLVALRSGEYQQARGELCALDEAGDVNGYCCLGVLAKSVFEIDNMPLNEGSWLEDIGLERVFGPADAGYGFLYGVKRPESWTNIQRALAALNDNGKSFTEIADFIEKNISACDAVKP